jgi:hypothetical protein
MATPTCPDTQTLAALVDGLLDNEQRVDVLGHLETCAPCMRQVVELAAATDSPVMRPPADLLARVRGRARRWSGVRVAGLAAAAVVLAVIWTGRHSDAPVASHPPQSTDAASVRSSGVASGGLHLETPRDDDHVAPGFEIVWHAPPGAAHFDVQVTTPEGDLLWSTQVEGRMTRVAVVKALPVDRPSYVWVTAHLREGRRLTSNVVRVRGRSGQ